CALPIFAALFVVLYHYTFHYGRRFGHLSSDYSTEIFSYGHYGVQLFFIISGFVIFMSVRRGRSAGDFLIKRAFRLYPAYIASIVITFIVLSSRDRKSTRLNSSHVSISYAVFCLKKKIKY